ncbi:MAG TPA: extracellular solute-binding protein [Gaiellaceae bacterium]|jgi:arabinogalactan oligomer/maltooligosaccharide transport system substrate-binding protein|nr:extracellular solute-binding protein [Gaiellaceae bacterium]
MLRLAAVLAIAAIAGVVAVGATARSKAQTLTIWADASRVPAIQKVAGAWAAQHGITINVVQKDFGVIQTSLGTVDASTAPDVVVGASDWVGGFSANGLVLPLVLSKTVKSQFPSYALDAMSYGTAVKRLWGLPVQLENIGLVVNTGLVKVPKTFAQLESEALAYKKKSSNNLGIAVQQGAGGDAYHMYPFFSGLCGYIFGKNSVGNLDPSNIGVANPKFLKNASLIDKWNKEGLINSKVDSGIAQNAFLKKQAAFWITGPWNSQTLKSSGLKYQIVQLPRISCQSVPFLGVQGLFVTKYAVTHGVGSAAVDLVTNYMAQPAAQVAVALAGGRPPANLKAAKLVKDPVLAQFSKAGLGGVPLPNIPQMASVWSELGGAWVKSTRGAGAVPAKAAFRTASRNIANKIG